MATSRKTVLVKIWHDAFLGLSNSNDRYHGLGEASNSKEKSSSWALGQPLDDAAGNIKGIKKLTAGESLNPTRGGIKQGCPLKDFRQVKVKKAVHQLDDQSKAFGMVCCAPDEAVTDGYRRKVESFLWSSYLDRYSSRLLPQYRVMCRGCMLLPLVIDEVQHRLLNDGKKYSLADIGEELGISKKNVHKTWSDQFEYLVEIGLSRVNLALDKVEKNLSDVTHEGKQAA